MTDMTAERHIKSFLAAVRRAIDPHRTVLTASTPYVVAGSVGSAGRAAIIAGTTAAERADADYIHLEFEPGSEGEGPVNVVVGMVRLGICHIRESCRFWQGDSGRMELIATVGAKAATMTFDPDGADSRPGLPKGDLLAGYERAAVTLRDLAAIPAPSNVTVRIRLPLAA